MGDGEEALGKTLLKGFLYAVSQLPSLPQTILYNTGARITCSGSDSLEDLKFMEAQGVEILTCGTCLDYYKLKETLAVGGVTNMYVIAEKLCRRKGHQAVIYLDNAATTLHKPRRVIEAVAAAMDSIDTGGPMMGASPLPGPFTPPGKSWRRCSIAPGGSCGLYLQLHRGAEHRHQWPDRAGRSCGLNGSGA